jgi:anti-sigma B factor antagonist
MLELKEEKGLLVGTISDTNRLTASVAPEIKQQMTDVLKTGGTQLVLNLTNIKFIDSTGIGSLISALKTARENNGVFKLAGVQEEVMSLLKLMKLDQIFDFTA